MAGRDPIVNSLQASVHRRLDEISRTLADTTPALGADLAHRNSTQLVEALRAVLADHRVDASGHCELCHGRRRRFFARRGPLPCRAYLAAQLTLDNGAEDTTDVLSAAARPHPHRRSRPDLHFAS